jgi:hypothetical protein
MTREGLFDLTTDPDEARNLLREGSPKVVKLAGRLRAELREWAASADPLASDFDQKHRDETLERLRSLGYID